MFAALLQPAIGNPFYSPPHPSPLSPRHANIPTIRPSQMSRSKQSPLDAENSSGTRDQKPASSQPQSYYSQRYATKISDPAAQISRTRASREKRRDAFFNRVKRDRDEGLFEKRGEQIQRMDYLAQRRKYYEALSRAAPDMEPDELSEDGDGDVEMGASGEQNWDEQDARALDEFLAQEEQQLQALLEEMEESGGSSFTQTQTQHQEGSSYYEDEEDYDNLFADFIAQGGDPPPSQNDNSMDMSHG